MEKLVIYDLNLQLCGDYQIKKELNNMIVLSSEDEEELVVDDEEDDTFEDYAVCPDQSQNHDYKHTQSAKITPDPSLPMNLRPSKNIKSSAHVDLRTNTPTDSESDVEDKYSMENAGNSSNVYCQELSNGNGCVQIANINHIKIEEELEDIDVGTYDLSRDNLTHSIETSFVESNIFEPSNKISRFGPREYSRNVMLFKTLRRSDHKPKTSNSDDTDSDLELKVRNHNNLRECFRRQQLKKSFDDLKHLIPSIKQEQSCSTKKILEEATFLCSQLKNDQIVYEKLKTEQRKINKQLRENLKKIIAETIF